METATASAICRHLVARASVRKNVTVKEVTRRVLLDVYVEAIRAQQYRRGALPLVPNATTTQAPFPNMPFGIKLDIMSHLGIHDLARLKKNLAIKIFTYSARRNLRKHRAKIQFFRRPQP